MLHPSHDRRIPLLLFGLAALASTWLALQGFELYSQRVNNLSELASDARLRGALLQRKLDSLRADVSSLRGQLALEMSDSARSADLPARVERAERSLETFQGTLQAQERGLEELGELRRLLDEGPVVQRLSALETNLRLGAEAVGQVASSALRTGERAQHRLDLLAEAVQHEQDLDLRWHELMGPVVQLAGENSVGSGVLLQSRPVGEGHFETYLLTAWHVVRDIQGDLDHTDMPVPVAIYAEGGAVRNEKARLLRFDAELDAALLQLETVERVDGARLAPRGRLEHMRVFDRIYAVGCPLGNDPVPTPGEVSSTHHKVDGQSYWMINAPTFIGNSGGGIFDAQTHELVGIFSKIYNYGSSRPTVVPHMGLATPLTRVYDWLENVGYAFIETGGTAAAQVASAPK